MDASTSTQVTLISASLVTVWTLYKLNPWSKKYYGLTAIDEDVLYDEEPQYYFGYGANMSSSNLKLKGLRSTKFVGRGILYDYYLNFSVVHPDMPDCRGTGNVSPQKGRNVHGTLLHMNKNDLKKMDVFEFPYH